MKKKLLTLIIFLTLSCIPVLADDIEDATIYYNEAIDVYAQQDIDKSVELFKKAIELNPGFYEAYYNLSQILMAQDKNEEAYSTLLKILQLRSDDETFYNLGKVQYKRGYLSSAYSYLTKINVNAPQYATAKLLISKIEKRQKELELEAKIAKHIILVDSQGRILAEDLTEITAPSGIAVDNKGNIYTASFSQNAIYKITPKGKKTIFSNSGLIKGPIGIAIDKDNDLYVANYSGNSIIRIKPTGVVSHFSSILKPYCLIYNSQYNRLYVTEQNTNRLVKYDL